MCKLIVNIGFALFMVSPLHALDGRGNGGEEERILLVAEAPERALEILGRVNPDDLEVGFIPPNLTKHGATKDRVAEWFTRNWQQLHDEFDKHELNTHSFDDVVSDLHREGNAYTKRSDDHGPIYFNVSRGHFKTVDGAAWILINEQIHHVDDDEVFDRSAWSVEDEDTFAAFMTGVLRLNFYRASYDEELDRSDYSSLRSFLLSSNRRPFLELLTRMAEEGSFDINRRYDLDDGKTLLMMAVRTILEQDFDSEVIPFQLAMISELLAKGADVDVRDENGHTVFHLIQARGVFWRDQPLQAATLLEDLLSRSAARAPYMNDLALNWAVEVGHVSYVNKLLESGTRPQKRFEAIRRGPEYANNSERRGSYLAILRPILGRGIPQEGLDFLYHMHVGLGHLQASAIIADFSPGVFGIPGHPELNVMMSVVDSESLTNEQKTVALEKLLERDDVAEWINSHTNMRHPNVFQDPEREGYLTYTSGFTRLMQLHGELNIASERSPFADQLVQFLDSGLERYGQQYDGSQGRSYLHMALNAGPSARLTALVKAMIDHGADINELDGSGSSPLLVAQFARRIYEHRCGPNYESADPSAQARYLQVISEQEELIAKLQENGATVQGEIYYWAREDIYGCGNSLIMSELYRGAPSPDIRPEGEVLTFRGFQ